MSGYVGANSVAEKTGKLYWETALVLPRLCKRPIGETPVALPNCGISWAHHWGTVRWAERCTSM